MVGDCARDRAYVRNGQYAHATGPPVPWVELLPPAQDVPPLPWLNR
jgi:hypothetical protein